VFHVVGGNAVSEKLCTSGRVRESKTNLYYMFCTEFMRGLTIAGYIGAD
jgi:hypothetical protein